MGHFVCDGRNKMLWKIVRDPADRTIRFAAEELKRYLFEIDPLQEVILLGNDAFADGRTEEKDERALYLGIGADLIPAGADSALDDAIRIDVADGHGCILGSNARSVLIGVYRFLREIGCAFLRPGRAGEVIPQKSLDTVRVSLAEQAAYRHRGMCIEGSVGYDHVMDMIDWLPKAGMNAYFIQFLHDPFIFYDRWYSHRDNELLVPTPLSPEEVRRIRAESVDEIKKRGLLYHAAGHGWTCEPLGIPGSSWDAKEYDLTEEQRSLVAEVNGKREIWQGISLNVNLCYSQQKVRDLVSGAVVKYLQENPQVDILHVWLSDGFNNHCECAQCAKKLPSEWYVILLNEIDRAMSAAGLPQKIVFLLYFDLLWPPRTERLENPDRFIMMFAPITRTYSESVADAPAFDRAKLPSFVRNRLSYPKSVSENLAWLGAWQEKVRCDSFDFDYHYMWDHYADPGYYEMAKILLEDVEGLRKTGLNGYVSCQVQRSWFPHGLGMHLMAEGLWNDRTEFEPAAEKYFLSAFGEKGLQVKAYLAELSAAFDPRFLRMETANPPEEDLQRLGTIGPLLDGFLPVIREEAENPALPPAVRKSWFYLDRHTEYCRLLAAALIEDTRNGGAGDAAYEDLFRWCRENETDLHPVFDVFEAILSVRRRQMKRDFTEDEPQ